MKTNKWGSLKQGGQNEVEFKGLWRIHQDTTGHKVEGWRQTNGARVSGVKRRGIE